jgi:NADH-quinone oxidoreductase subunit L
MIELIVFLPLLGFLIASAITISTRAGLLAAHGHNHADDHHSGLLSQPAEFITTGFLFIAALLSWIMFYRTGFAGENFRVSLFCFIDVGDLAADWRLRVDTLTAVMLVVVNTVSALVHLYSIGYMSHDPHRPRFFAYLSLFTFAMLMLVSADNFVQMFFGWEGVGLASYLLIGFWFDRPSANAAAIKAFIVNRIGDFGFALGIFASFWVFGSVSFDTLFASAPAVAGKSLHFLWFEADALTLICCLLFIGAMGKSAQFLLHTWLPDAMEGPTPVSALIHAATMVTAGVFMVARLSPLFEYAPVALAVVTFFGAITAFFAASVGLVQNDIKRIIAYSTCSQLGYMFVALGAGAYSIGIFHLFTHAFFKALLFLGAGSVIHAVSNEQDIRKMGALSKLIPLTYVTMLIGTLSLTGFLFTAGYYSKDAIIEADFTAHNAMASFAFALLELTAFMTSFYSWRLIFIVFHGPSNLDQQTREHVHESPRVMTIPLILLAAGALLAGFIFSPFFAGEQVTQFWRGALFFSADNHVLHDMHNESEWIALSPTIAMALGFALAWLFYIKRPDMPKHLARSQPLLYEFLLNKWYFDELYDILFVRSAKWLGRFLWKKGDGAIIDGLGPDGISARIVDITHGVVRLQSGYVYHYAFAMLIGVTALITWYLFLGNIR